MKINVNTEIALTYLFARKKQTVVASLGVMFGISMFIFMQSMMKGTNDYFEKSSFSSTPHIRLYNEPLVADNHLLRSHYRDSSLKVLINPKQLKTTQGINNPYGIIQMFKKNPKIAAITPQVSASVIYASGNATLNGSVAGVNIDEEDKMFDIKSNMVSGQLTDLNKVSNGILIGIGIAQKLSLHVGDHITVRVGSGNALVMKVIGIYATTIKQIDETKSYANISQIQNLLGKGRSYVTDIKVNLIDYQKAPEVAAELALLTGYKVEDWVKSNEQLKAAFKVRAIILNSVIGVILLVAGFGIYNILNMTIYEKIKEIAILKATGFSGPSVVSIFLQQAIFIGLIGGVAGEIFGFGITFLVSKIYIGAGTLKYLPMSFYPLHYVEAICFGVVTTIAAGYFPALKASKVDPVNIIRG
jgi:lipoprotein-releasing system permease protein